MRHSHPPRGPLTAVEQDLPRFTLRKVLQETQTCIPITSLCNQSLFIFIAGLCETLEDSGGLEAGAGLDLQVRNKCCQEVHSRQALGLRAGPLPPWHGGPEVPCGPKDLTYGICPQERGCGRLVIPQNPNCKTSKQAIILAENERPASRLLV